MSSPMLHIKDSYYFDVPKMLWQYKSLEDVPQFLRKAHPDATIEQFNAQLAGKIIISQPFGGKLKNLYEKESGFCVSKYMILEIVVAALLVFVFSKVAKSLSTTDRPKGKFVNLFESFLVYIKEQIAEPAIGHHHAEQFLPYLWTVFFFVLFCNLFGMIPWLGAPTSAFAVTLTLAAATFCVVLSGGIKQFGALGFIKNLVPHMDMPLALKLILVPVIWAIEAFSLVLKHCILAVRLLANMVAGHLVILGIMGLAFSIEGARSGSWPITATIAVLGSTLFFILELFVAFLQAYVFTFLSALFIGSVMHEH
jgi:F-type H+-transporting ATPase subunit a